MSLRPNKYLWLLRGGTISSIILVFYFLQSMLKWPLLSYKRPPEIGAVVIFSKSQLAITIFYIFIAENKI